jgi:hypothetical protein
MGNCGRISISLPLKFMEMCIVTVSFCFSKPVNEELSRPRMVSVVIHEPRRFSRCTGN